MSAKQLVEYDPNLKLSNAITDINFEHQLIHALNQTGKVSKKSIIHFNSDDCFCQFVASEHIQTLSNELMKKGFESIHINLQNQPKLKSFVPSTPSLAIIGEQQELIYLGPYAEGYGCLTGTSLVDNILQKVFTEELENTVFVTEAKGCYCQS